MLATTDDILRTALKADPTVTPSERRRLLALMRRDEPLAPPPHGFIDRIVRRAETAKLFGRSQRFVDMLGEAGVLQRVYLPGRTRGAGFRLSDVMALISGGREAI